MLLVAATVQIRFGKASTRCSEERKISAKRLQSRNQGHARSQRTHRQLPMDADKRARLRCTTHADLERCVASVSPVPAAPPLESDMTIRPIAAAMMLALSTLVIAGCQDNNTSKDVADARVDASKDTAEARKDASAEVAEANDKVADARSDYADQEQDAREELTETEAAAMVQRANAEYDVATTQIEGNYAVAKEACDALSGVEKTACVSEADATRAADQAQATATRDAALVAADQH